MVDLIEYTPSEALTQEFPEFGKITVYGTSEDPLFPVSQVQEFIKSDRIRLDRGDYDAGEDYIKVVCERKDGKSYEQNMLTEDGLYRVLFKTNTEVSKKFRRFTKVVMRELRLRGQVTLTSALVKLKLLETDIADRDKQIMRLDGQLEEEHDKVNKYRRESVKFYTQKMALSDKNAALEIRLDRQTDGIRYDTEAQLEKIKERCMKRVYVYMIKPPKKLEDDFPDFDEDIEPTEDDDICFELGSRRGDRIAVAEVHIYRDVTMADVYLRLADEGMELKIADRILARKYRGSIEHLRSVIDRLL